MPQHAVRVEGLGFRVGCRVSGLRFQGKTELISLKGPKDANQDGPSGASRKGLSKLDH